jgi:hypothetical protein
MGFFACFSSPRHSSSARNFTAGSARLERVPSAKGRKAEKNLSTGKQGTIMLKRTFHFVGE